MEADVGVERRIPGDLEQRFDVGCPVLRSHGLGHILVNFLQTDKSSSRNVDSPPLLYNLLAAVKVELELFSGPVLVPEMFSS